MISSQKIKSIFLLFFIFSFFSIEAENPVIIIFDGNNQIPLSEVKVNIIDPGNNKQIAEGLSDIKGIVFWSDSITKGTYSFILFHSIYGKEFQDNINCSQDTIRLIMGVKNKQLDEVTVTAIRKQIKQDAKGNSMDLTSIKEAAYWSMQEAIKRLPGITIDVQGIIRYMGEPVAIRENGMPPGIKAEQLLSLPANQYKSIELILHDPKSKNDGPILNLVRTPQEIPFGGSVNIGASLKSQNASIRLGLQHKSQMLEITPMYNYYTTPTSTSSSSKYIPQYDYKEMYTTSQNAPNRGSPTFRLRYNLSLQKHLLDITASYGSSSRTSTNSGYETEYYTDTLFRSFSLENNRKLQLRHWSAVLGYKYTYNPHNKWYITLDLSNNTNRTDESSLIGMEKGSYPPFSAYQKQKKKNNPNLFSAISYEHNNTQWGTLEIGAKYFYRQEDYSLLHAPIFHNDSLGMPETADYLNDYHYTALFASWTHKINQFNFNLVLKGDYSTDQIKYPDSKTFSFGTFSPYLSIYRNFNGHGLRWILQYSELRPTLEALNPTIEPGTNNGRIILKGNPNLQPSQNYSTTLSYDRQIFKKLETNISIRYSYIHDDIATYRKLAANSTTTEFTYENLNNKQDIYTNLQLSYPLTSEWSCTLSTTSIWNRVSNESELQTFQSWMNDLNLEYTKKKWQYSASVSYNKLDNFQVSGSGWWQYDIGARYTYKKWNVAADISNPLPFYKIIRNTYNTDEYEACSMIKERQFNINIRISYSFGKSTSGKRAKSILVDDM